VSAPMRPRTVPAAVVGTTETIHLGGNETIPCPGFEQVPIARSARHLGLGTTGLVLPAPRVLVLRNVVVGAGAATVLDRHGRIVAESLTSDMTGRVTASGDDPVDLDGTVAIYRSPWAVGRARLPEALPRAADYHLLIDELPRAALLAQPAVGRIGPLRLLHAGPLSPLEQRLLERLLDGRLELVEVDPQRAVRATRVVLPGYVTRPMAGAVPTWYRRWIDRYVGAVDAPSARTLPQRVYVDPRMHSERVRNRDELDEVLLRHRVERVDPSTMDLDERLVTFRDARVVVGVTGSGLADALFSRRAAVIELVPGQELLPHAYYLAASKGLPHHAVFERGDGHRLSVEKRVLGDTTVDVETLDRLLERS